MDKKQELSCKFASNLMSLALDLNSEGFPYQDVLQSAKIVLNESDLNGDEIVTECILCDDYSLQHIRSMAIDLL